jgi:hypothetical protein
LYEKSFIESGFYQLTMDTSAKSSANHGIRTYLVIGVGVIGAVLLVLGIILSIYGFSTGIEIAVFGLIIVVVSLIAFVVATDGIDTKDPAQIWPGS